MTPASRRIPVLLIAGLFLALLLSGCTGNKVPSPRTEGGFILQTVWKKEFPKELVVAASPEGGRVLLFEGKTYPPNKLWGRYSGGLVLRRFDSNGKVRSSTKLDGDTIGWNSSLDRIALGIRDKQAEAALDAAEAKKPIDDRYLRPSFTVPMSVTIHDGNGSDLGKFIVPDSYEDIRPLRNTLLVRNYGTDGGTAEVVDFSGITINRLFPNGNSSPLVLQDSSLLIAENEQWTFAHVNENGDLLQRFTTPTHGAVAIFQNLGGMIFGGNLLRPGESWWHIYRDLDPPLSIYPGISSSFLPAGFAIFPEKNIAYAITGNREILAIALSENRSFSRIPLQGKWPFQLDFSNFPYQQGDFFEASSFRLYGEKFLLLGSSRNPVDLVSEERKTGQPPYTDLVIGCWDFKGNQVAFATLAKNVIEARFANANSDEILIRTPHTAERLKVSLAK